MFDLASVLNQPETIDLALLYDRVALALRPQFPLAQLLLADILSAQNKPEESLAVLSEIPKDSPYYWSAQLRAAVNLDTLDRTDEAIAQLKTMAAENPNSIGALVTLGDILRSKKRFAEAADAYDEAIRRTEAAGLPESWTLFYDRGVALERSGQWEKAEADLQKALELKPDQPMVLNYLGYSWIDRGENLEQRHEDDREGGRAAPGGRLHRRQPGLGALPDGRLRGGGRKARKGDRAGARRTRRSTTISATPTGASGGSSKRAINGAGRCSSGRRKTRSSRSRPSSSTGSTPPPRRPRRLSAGG